MKQFIGIVALCALLASLTVNLSCNRDPYTYAMIETNMGNMKVKLYNETPRHRDNFIKLANESFYDSLLFHRVINGFMIQGGDPRSKSRDNPATLGQGGPGYTLEQEIGLLHFKGALSAARLPDQMNPKKESSGSQFFIVQGTVLNDQQLNAMEQHKGIKYSEAQRNLYKELGGFPSLDMDYTVFGEVVEGMEVIDKIAGVPTGERDLPLEDVRMFVKILN